METLSPVSTTFELQYFQSIQCGYNKGGKGKGASKGTRSAGGGGSGEENNVTPSDLEAKGWASVQASALASAINKSPEGEIKDAVKAALSQSPDSVDMRSSGIRSRIVAMADIGGKPGRNDRGTMTDAFGMAQGTQSNSLAGRALSLQLERSYSKMSEAQKNVFARRLQRDGFIGREANHAPLERIRVDAAQRVQALQQYKFSGSNFSNLFR